MDFPGGINLKNLVLVKLATILLGRDNKHLVISLRRWKFDKMLPPVSLPIKINQSVEALSLPNVLEDKLKNILTFMNLKLNTFIKQNELLHDMNATMLIGCLHWTHNGQINIKKTIDHIKSHNIDINHRFLIVCYYCYEEEFLNLWDELPFEHRVSFLNDSTICNKYWKFRLSIDIPKSLNFYYYAPLLKKAFEAENTLAILFFWGKLDLKTQYRLIIGDLKYFYILFDAFYQAGYTMYLEEIIVLKYATYFQKLTIENWLFVDCYSVLDACKQFLTRDNCLNAICFLLNLAKEYPVTMEMQKIFTRYWRQTKARILPFTSNDKFLSYIVEQLRSMKDWDNLHLVFTDLTTENKIEFFTKYPDLMKIEK